MLTLSDTIKPAMQFDQLVMNDRLTILEVKSEVSKTNFADHVRDGLSTEGNRELHPAYFYDKYGSELFEKITTLDEYYLTRCEASILSHHHADITSLFSGVEEPVMVELGSGSSTKTKTLIRSILNQKGKLLYIPIDISESMLKESSQSLLQEFPSLKIVGVAAEYSAGLRLIHERYSDRTKLILWLGSSIGNLPRKEATNFLASVRESMTVNDRILIGMDLKKDIKELLAAYNDSLGVTAEFNTNMLVRINNGLQANFRYDKFEHRSVWNPSEGRIEMHLFSKEDHTVNIKGLDLVLHFSKGESIHTENCHKYDQKDIETTASSSGFVVSNQWFDTEHKFSLNLFAPLTSSS